MAKKKKDDKVAAPKKTVKPKSPKTTQPSNAELSLRLAVVETRLSALVEALSKAKSVKGI